MNKLLLTSINIGFSDIDSDMMRTILMVAIPVGILLLILLVAAFANLAKKKVPAIDKLVWVVIVLFSQPIGPIIYFAIGSGLLDKKAAELNGEDESE